MVYVEYAVVILVIITFLINLSDIATNLKVLKIGHHHFISNYNFNRELHDLRIKYYNISSTISDYLCSIIFQLALLGVLYFIIPKFEYASIVYIIAYWTSLVVYNQLHEKYEQKQYRTGYFTEEYFESKMKNTDYTLLYKKHLINLEETKLDRTIDKVLQIISTFNKLKKYTENEPESYTYLSNIEKLFDDFTHVESKLEHILTIPNKLRETINQDLLLEVLEDFEKEHSNYNRINVTILNNKTYLFCLEKFLNTFKYYENDFIKN